MDKATTLLLLESYRPEDADDPAFAEALRQVTTDPELAARFGEMQDFDAAMRAKLRAASRPGGREGAHLAWSHAASDVVACSPPRHGVDRSRRGSGGARAGRLVAGCAKHQPGRALALQAIACNERMPALQFVCFDAAVVASWVNRAAGHAADGPRAAGPREIPLHGDDRLQHRPLGRPAGGHDLPAERPAHGHALRPRGETTFPS